MTSIHEAELTHVTSLNIHLNTLLKKMYKLTCLLLSTAKNIF